MIKVWSFCSIKVKSEIKSLPKKSLIKTLKFSPSVDGIFRKILSLPFDGFGYRTTSISASDFRITDTISKVSDLPS
jgi:hypothetical protein